MPVVAAVAALLTVRSSPRETVMLVPAAPVAWTPKLPLLVPSTPAWLLALTVMIPPASVETSMVPAPVVEASRPIELSPFTVTDVPPIWMVAVPVPVAAASTPMLLAPVFDASFRMVTPVPDVRAPKPWTLALTLVPPLIASMPTTDGFPAPASVTVMVSLVDPAMLAEVPDPLDLEMMPATLAAPPLTTVSESESARLALESLVALSTSMALIVGSIVSPAPRLTVATPSPVVVATTPWWPASTVTLSPRVTVTAATLAPLVIVALTPMPVEVPAGLALMCVPVTVSTSTEPVPLVVASTPSTLAHSSSPFTCTATSPALAALLTSAWMPTRAMSGVPSL